MSFATLLHEPCFTQTNNQFLPLPLPSRFPYTIFAFDIPHIPTSATRPNCFTMSSEQVTPEGKSSQWILHLRPVWQMPMKISNSTFSQSSGPSAPPNPMPRRTMSTSPSACPMFLPSLSSSISSPPNSPSPVPQRARRLRTISRWNSMAKLMSRTQSRITPPLTSP